MALSAKPFLNKILICVFTLSIISSLTTSCGKVNEIPTSIPEPIENTTIPSLGSIQQWYLSNDGTNENFISANSWWTDERNAETDVDIDFFEGMELYTENRTTIVAVIDTDINTDLFFETGNLWMNQAEIPDDGLDNDRNGYIDDIYGWNFCTNSRELCSEDTSMTHGNNIVGVLAGCNNFPEYTAMFGDTKNQVMGLKAVSDNNEGQIQQLIEAIRYAENNGANICCLALSTCVDNSNLYELIKESEMLFIVAAGNDGVELGTDVLGYPAMYQLENVITVADIRCDGQISKTSNYSDQYVDVFAPGTDIICVSSHNGYEFVSGTSISTSIVSGICALVRSSWSKELSPGEIKQILIDSSKKEVKSETSIEKGGLASLYQCLTSEQTPFEPEKNRVKP